MTPTHENFRRERFLAAKRKAGDCVGIPRVVVAVVVVGGCTHLLRQCVPRYCPPVGSSAYGTAELVSLAVYSLPRHSLRCLTYSIHILPALASCCLLSLPGLAGSRLSQSSSRKHQFFPWQNLRNLRSDNKFTNFTSNTRTKRMWIYTPIIIGEEYRMIVLWELFPNDIVVLRSFGGKRIHERYVIRINILTLESTVPLRCGFAFNAFYPYR